MEIITYTRRRWWLRIPTNSEAVTTPLVGSITQTKVLCKIQMSELPSPRRRSCHPRESMANLGAKPTKRISLWHITRRAGQSHQKLATDIKSLARSTIKITIQTQTRKATLVICRQSTNRQTSTYKANRANHKFSTQLVTPTTQAVPPTRRIWSISKTRGCSSTKIQRSALAQLVAHQTTRELVLASATRPLASWSIIWTELMPSHFKIKMFTIQ